MKTLIILILIFLNKTTFADWGFLGNSWLADWDVGFDDIPNMIAYASKYFMSLAWVVAVIFIIIWWYQVMFGSVSQDTSKWKNTIIAAIMWFVLAALAWVIVKFILDNVW